MPNNAKNPDIETAIRRWPYGYLYRRHGPLDCIRIFPRRKHVGRPFTPRHEQLLRRYLTRQGIAIDDNDLRRALLRVSLDPIPQRRPSEALLRRCRELAGKLMVTTRGSDG
jgi:hypothetical protein